MRVQTSVIVNAPADLVRNVYADYTAWPEMFPTISAVRVRERRGSTLVLEVDHVEGTVINELTLTNDGELVLGEIKRRYDAVFVNRFDPIPAGTLFTVRGELWFKGVARLLEPVLIWYVRRQMKLLQLEPVKARAEANSGRASELVAGFRASTTIDAPIDVVWNVLVDVERMPEWTPSMRSVRLLDGIPLGRGSRVHIKQPWLLASTWTVDLFDPPRYFSWRSRSGTVETTAMHLLEDRGGTTLATLSIQHSGPGSAIVGLLVRPLTRRYLNWELRGLKARSEHPAS
jgi:uncharacterized membrane protein